MLGSSPTRLIVRQPSPTTTLYSVSTRPVRRTRLSRLSHYVSVAARLLVAIVCVAVLLIQARCWLGGLASDTSEPVSTKDVIAFTWSQQRFNQLHAAVTGNKHKMWSIAGACMAVSWVLSRRNGLEESLLVMRELGIQMSTSSRSYLSAPTTRFIPSSQIQDIFIHEAFKGFEVKFYMAVIVEKEKDAVVVFPKLLPNREILEEVWRGTRAVLYQASKTDRGNGST